MQSKQKPVYRHLLSAIRKSALPSLAIYAIPFPFSVPMVLDSAFRVPLSAFPWLFALCALLLPLALAGPTEGGSLSITTQVTVSVTGERVHGLVTVTNGGNVPAHRVRVDIALPGARIRPAGEQTLGAARSADFPFEGRVRTLLKGRHPLSVMVHFQDSLGHPFSALTATTFLVREEKALELKVLGESVVLGERGTVRFRIENTGALPKALRTSFLVPREFYPSDPLGESILPGGGLKEEVFTLANLSALPGATYPVFCIVEYEREDTHHTAIGMSTVLVTAGENWLRKTSWAWAGGLPALGALLAIGAAIRRKRKGIP